MSRSDSLVENSFDGYRRPDGRVAVRNRILVLPSVICSHLVAEEIAEQSPRAVATPHDHGCAQLGADNEQTEQTFLGTAANPNIAGTVVVGLGCEHVQSDEVAAAIDERGLPVRELSIQGVGGTGPCIKEGSAAATELARNADSTRAAPASIDDLTVGVVVGDLDDSTIEHADPLVAELVDRVVAAGGSAVVAGNERFAAHPDAVRQRSAPATLDDIDAMLERHEGLPSRANAVGRAAASADADATLGALGTNPIQDVLSYGEQAPHDSGLAVVDAPSRFEEAATALAAAGAHIVVHVTAEGVPAGHPIVPVLKISGDVETLEALPADIDINAREASADDLERALLAVAGGQETCTESHGLSEFAITRIGPSM
ncbi:UxaA family hydrolase [Halorubrum halophilum]|uniref:UxaA family hydrolase n=1 Tax=Halorubrum halophilum TaxID=413816 RepID=UPI000678E362|nr:UxaA family hydrolase [Halorubrum halophilum]